MCSDLRDHGWPECEIRHEVAVHLLFNDKSAQALRLKFWSFIQAMRKIPEGKESLSRVNIWLGHSTGMVFVEIEDVCPCRHSPKICSQPRLDRAHVAVLTSLWGKGRALLDLIRRESTLSLFLLGRILWV